MICSKDLKFDGASLIYDLHEMVCIMLFKLAFHDLYLITDTVRSAPLFYSLF